VSGRRGSEARGALLALSAELATGRATEWEAGLRAAASVAKASEVEEVILQSYLFVGFPVILNALSVWRTLSPPPAGRPDPDVAERTASGERLCRVVYGAAYDRLRAHVARLHPDLDRWMIEEGYGKTLSREGLSAVERELCVVSLLAAAGHIPQLRSHLRGALNLGATPEAVEESIETGLAVAARNREARDEPAPDVRAAWRRVRAEVAEARARPDGVDGAGGGCS